MLFAILLLTSRGSAVAGTFLWQASSGATPDAVSQGMTLVDDAAQNPALSSGILTLTTTVSANSMFYIHSGSVMGITDLPQIETTMRFVSGGFSGGRAPAMISFGVGSGYGANILFKQDLVQTSDAAGSVIRQSASVDTDGSFHTYRIELAGISVGSSFTVFQDNVAILTDTLQTSVGAFGSAPNVAFGDLSSIAFGTSQWQSFSHNMLIPEPGRSLLIGLSSLVLLQRRRHRPCA